MLIDLGSRDDTRTFEILVKVEVSTTKGNGIQNFYLRDQDVVNCQFEGSLTHGHLEYFLVEEIGRSCFWRELGERETSGGREKFKGVSTNYPRSMVAL
jgi:hypothetical protein